jgi:hypothetical protein
MADARLWIARPLAQLLGDQSAPVNGRPMSANNYPARPGEMIGSTLGVERVLPNKIFTFPIKIFKLNIYIEYFI